MRSGFPGSAGVPPASGPKAHRCVQAGKMPALPGKRSCGAVFLGARASRPQVGRRPTGVFKRSRCPRSRESAHAERFSWERGRPARKWAEGPPVCSSGQDARAPGKALMRSGFPGSAGVPPASGPKAHRCVQAVKMPALPGKRSCGAVFLGARASRPQVGRRPTGVFKRARCPRSRESAHAERFSWERGRPARKWAEGPPVCSSGQDARAPRKALMRSGFPGSAGVPPASGPKTHRCVQAGKMPALPGVAPVDRVDLPGETQNEICCRGLMPQAAVRGLEAAPAGPISAHREVGGPRAREVA